MSKISLLLGILLTAGGLCTAAPRSVDATPASGPIKLDGKISETAWEKAPWQENFTRMDGKAAAEPTRFKVLAGQRGLYFAFEATDTTLKSEHKDHDGPLWADDCIEIFILPEPAPAADPNIREYKHFIFNSVGARFERAVKAGVGSTDWNVPWKVAAVKTDKGFDAEVFIPYYAVAPFSEARTWRFNIGRENHGGKRGETSVWSPTKQYQDAENFGVLNNIPVDLAAYAVSFFSSGVRMQSVDGKVLPVVEGNLNGTDKTCYTVQTAARTPAGTLAAFNAVNATPLQGKAPVAVPLEIAASGQYVLATSVIAPDGRTVAYEEKPVTVTIAAFEAKLIEPHYRNNIYLALPDPKLTVTVKQFAAPAEYKQAVLTVTVRDESGKTVAEKTLQGPAQTETVTFDAANFAPGAFQVKTALRGAGKNDGEFTHDFNVIARHTKGNLITLDRERRVLINGKPFFFSGFCGWTALADVRKSGFNIMTVNAINYGTIDKILKTFDEAHRYGLMIAICPRHQIRNDFFSFTENGKKVRTLSAESYKKMETMVKAVKDHPAFFGWNLYDEPRGAELVAELKREYEFLRKIDPEHPVIGGDNTADGCIAKKGHCDIHLLDLYLDPQFNAPPHRSIASLSASVQSIVDATGDAVWYQPQAFNLGSFINGKFPTPTYAETRVSVFSTIAAGATGIIPYKIGRDSCKYFEKHVNSGIYFSPEMKVGWLDGLGPEIKNLTPVLLADSIPVQCSSGKLRVMGRKLNGRHFVIATNPQTVAVDAEIVWPDRQAQTLRVLGEKRTEALKNGKLAKTFAPYAVHVYTDDAAYPEGVDIAAVTAKIAEELRTAKKE